MTNDTPDPLYVVTTTRGPLAIGLGVAGAQLHRGEVLPSGATVYRPESTGALRDLCRQAETLNAADRATRLERLAGERTPVLTTWDHAEAPTDPATVTLGEAGSPVPLSLDDLREWLARCEAAGVPGAALPTLVAGATPPLGTGWVFAVTVTG